MTKDETQRRRWTFYEAVKIVGEEFLTAQEIREIGEDVAERIRERMEKL